MKMTYSKPEIVFENFTMSTNIAAGCDGPKVGPVVDSCYVDGTGGIRMFDGDMRVCDYTPGSGDKYDGYCYHVPTDANNLFNS